MDHLQSYNFGDVFHATSAFLPFKTIFRDASAPLFLQSVKGRHSMIQNLFHNSCHCYPFKYIGHAHAKVIHTLLANLPEFL